MEKAERLEQKLGFDRVRTMIADRCSTDYAAARVEEETFSTDPAVIRKRLALTDEMRLILMFEENFPTSGYIDCLPFLEPIGKNASIDLLSLGRLRTMLDTLRKVTTFFRGIKDGIYPALKQMSSGFPGFPDIQRRIDGILDKYGEIKDTASDKLYEIRTSIREKEINVSKRMNAILRKAQQDGLVEADASISIRDGKMLLPVTSAKKRQFQGFVYDESATGKTTFMEPAEVVALTNEISELRFAETREIARILHEFSEFLRPYVPDLSAAAIFLGEIDFLMAKANVALDFIAGMPVLSESGELALRKARHPLLEKALRKEGRSIVPLTATLTPAKHILMISGPNAGGKSVCLKTVGLLQYMFQWGMLIPTSETSELPVLELDRRGTYGVITTHYTNLKLYSASGETGVINGAMQFDAQNIAPLFQLEMGLPGNSFAFELARKMGLPQEIVKDAEERAGEEFVGIERNLRKIARNRRALDEKLTKIRATDKTLEAVTDKYQKELEDIKQLRQKILDEAKREAEEIIKGANKQVESTIRTIKESQAEKEATKDARAELQGFLGALAEKKLDDKRKREEYLDKKLKTLQERKEREKARKARRAAKSGKEIPDEESLAEEKLAAFRTAPLKVGEKVRIKDSGMVGEVSKVSTKAVTIIVGNLSTKLPLDRVERVTSNEFRAAVRETPKPRQVYDTGIAERKANFRMELDVRGQRVGEAIENVMRYIDDAIMLDVGSVRILHGKGTGALREEIQKYIRTVPGVVSVADEHIQFGGSGVTVVKFG